MALQLIPPGKRGNASYLARGRVNGQLYEKSLRTTDRRLAQRALRAVEAEIAQAGTTRGNETFALAAERYKAFKAPRAVEEARIDAITRAIGQRRLRDLTVAELHDLANRLKPGTAGATRNREVLRTAAAIWHYAADAGMCDYTKVKLFPEDKPRTMALSREAASDLIAATEEGGYPRLLLLWLFHVGMRVSHAICVQWEQIDLAKGTVSHREIKGRHQHDYVFPLHQEVLEELAKHYSPGQERRGPVFPWRTKSGVYRWLKPLVERVGVTFTPHMARHSKGTWMNDEGAGTRTIMEALGHASEKSSIRYQHGNVEIVRAAGAGISLKKERA